MIIFESPVTTFEASSVFEAAGAVINSDYQTTMGNLISPKLVKHTVYVTNYICHARSFKVCEGVRYIKTCFVICRPWVVLTQKKNS